MSLNHIKLVTFDATNTLLKFKVPPWEYYASVARDHGFNGTGEVLKNRLLNSFKIIGNEHPNFGRDTIQWMNWWKRVVKHTFEGQLPASANINLIADKLINEFKTSNCWTRAEGADKLLKLLRNKGITIGVLSNFDPRLHDILHNVSLSSSFNFIATSYEIGYSKPDHKIFNYVIENLNNNSSGPSESLHIGDDIKKDYLGAKSAGWNAILLSKNVEDDSLPQQLVFKSLTELSSAIAQEKLKLS